ncbi:NAC domain-domain-containing protein, partial [Catenaria anguillulae PL171]
IVADEAAAKARQLQKEAQARQAESLAAASRGERKAKKAFEGLGLTPISGINRVVFKRPRNELIVIQDPEVYKSSTADVYIVYGQATMAKNQLPGLNPLAAGAGAAKPGAHVHDANCKHDEDDPADALPELIEDMDVSDDAAAPEGISEKEIDMVIKQSGASRGQAISAIRSNGGDVAAAIMQLTE